MNLLSHAVPRALLALALIACALPVGAQSTGDGAVATTEALPEQSLSPQVFYEFLLAEVAGARGQFNVAVPAYLDLARRTRDPRIARRATDIALFSRQIPAAAEAARIWSEADPASMDAKRVLAGVMMGAGSPRLDEAQAQLARILAQAGDRLPQTLLGLNRALAQVEDKAAVRTAIERVTEPYLNLPETHFARAQAALTAQDEVAARRELERALALRKDWEPAILFQAQLLHTSDPHAARVFLADYLTRHPDSVAGRVAHAKALAGEQDFAAALLEFRRLQTENPEDVDILNANAILALQAGQLEEADRLFRQLLVKGSRDGDGVRMYLGQIADQQKKYDQAIEWYRGVEGAERRSEAVVRMAQSMASAGRVDEARRQLRALTGDGASLVRYRLAEAQMLRDAERVEEAYRVVEEALRDAPDDGDLLYESAMLAERRGQLDTMEMRLKKLIALKPESPHAYNALGYALADRSLRLEEAESLIRKALALAPDDPFIIDSMGWVRFRRNDPNEAMAYLEKAYKLRADPEIAAHLGEVYWNVGRKDEARKLWAEALAASPDSAPLKAVIKRFPK